MRKEVTEGRELHEVDEIGEVGPLPLLRMVEQSSIHPDASHGHPIQSLSSWQSGSSAERSLVRVTGQGNISS